MPGVPSVQLSHSTTTRCARIRKLVPTTVSSMTAGSASFSPRRRWAGSAMAVMNPARRLAARRQNLDQLAASRVNLRMLELPLDRDLLERHVLLAIAVDHRAHARAGQEMQVCL